MKPSLFAFSALPLYLAAPGGYTDALSVYAGKTGFPVLRDRFGFLNQFSPYRLYEPHLPLYGTGSTERLADIMDARAAEIIRKARGEGRELYLFVSGGVDSTAMTCALLRAAGGNMHGLHVVHTRYSVREYPAFFAFLRGLVDLIEVQPGRALDDAQIRAMELGQAVTGWCADQLFGSQINHDYPGWFFRDWRGWVGFDDAVQQLEAAFNHYGLPVKTFGEFAWFMNFACKYDIVRHQDVWGTGEVTGRMTAFYDTPAFNRWSLSHFDVLHRYPQQDTEHYKRPLKEYIFAYNHDADYLHGKGKEGSWGLMDAGDSPKLWMYPVRAVAMESPSRAVVQSGDAELPLTSLEFIRLSEANTQTMLDRYLR